MKYKYEIKREVVQVTRVEIEADSVIDADTRARRIMLDANSKERSGNLDWWIDENKTEWFVRVDEEK